MRGEAMKENVKTIPRDFSAAVRDIKLAILQARARAARVSNVEALKLYFYVGGYVSKKTRAAKWGSGALDALSERLQVELPGLRGFSSASIKYMRLFYDAWSPYLEVQVEGLRQIRHSASDDSAPASSTIPIRHLASDEFQGEDFAAFVSVGFTHHREILNKCETFDERLYYIHACAKENWTVIELERHLRADDYHHVGALPNNFAKTLSPMTLATKAVRSFRDEYLLELVNLDNVDAVHDQDVDERVLSKGLVANIEKTIAALGGNDFCFMGREKRLMVEGEELFVDLLFYHRSLQAMVAIELKMGKFRASYLGQLSQYLSVLDALERKPNENPSIGLLLCEKMNKPIVQLTVQGYSQPIGIATYQALRNIPDPYKALAPVIDGVRRVLVEHRRETRKAHG
jgi:predicted nuclease of restriction endonuclease-like (RecB) superfamily